MNKLSKEEIDYLRKFMRYALPGALGSTLKYLLEGKTVLAFNELMDFKRLYDKTVPILDKWNK